jgi:AcrR family transcriptional regulator
MNQADPRVRRTRKLLQQALTELLAEKSFHAINVQDVVDRATVNRATFYAHFPDKYALLDYVVGEWFREELSRAELGATPFNESNLRTLIHTVLTVVRTFHGGCRPGDRDVQPMLETKLQTVLAEFLEDWLQKASAAPSAAARLVSWTIFGSAMEWARESDVEDLDARVDQILQFVLNGMSRLAPRPHRILAASSMGVAS